MGNGAAEDGRVYLLRKYGRHEETRTPDLYRVNLSITFTFNHLQVAGDCLTTTKYVEVENLAGDFAGEKLQRPPQARFPVLD
jgi:hypothetical protein